MQKDQHEYVFIAGGIGVTPFRSIIKYLTDKKISSHITLFYIAYHKDEFLFEEVFEKAAELINVKTVYVLSNPQKDWKGEIGKIDEALIKKHVADVTKPIYYISGPQKMVFAYQELLQRIGVPYSQIKTDFFAGYEENYAG